MHNPVVVIDYSVDNCIVGVKFMHTPVVFIDNTVDKLSQS